MSDFQSIKQKIEHAGAQLVAVSKTQPLEKILHLYEQGQRIFGENRVQELLKKQPLLPSDIEWHLIGHLQTNKVRQVLPHVALIHSVESWKLLQTIDREAQKLGKVQDCLLQFHIAEETTKFGLSLAEAQHILQSSDFQLLRNVRLLGVMGMGSFTENHEQVRQEFNTLRHIFQTLKNEFFTSADFFREISMGMSGDWEIALEEGSTLCRIGSLLFSEN